MGLEHKLNEVRDSTCGGQINTAGPSQSAHSPEASLGGRPTCDVRQGTKPVP